MHWKTDGISKKIYLELASPTEEDSRSSQMRILDGLKEQGIKAQMTAKVMRKLYPLCEKSSWRITVSLAWKETGWMAVDLEAGDTSREHYGLAVDLGSTTVVARMIDCNTEKILGESGSYNRQIAYGTDILTRIFYCKDDPEKLEELRRATVDSIRDNLRELEEQTGISCQRCIQMVVAGNMTMIHFLIGMDAFCVFHTPYAVRASQPGFLLAEELLDLPLPGYVYCVPGKSNYLGGDIISGMIATELPEHEELSVFLDIGTNGELVVGNREFLICGAGAAGPALEGGVVRTGMRAVKGAVSAITLSDGIFHLETIGNGTPKGICGSGIVDMIAELFLNGWLDVKGKFRPEASDQIRWLGEEYGVEYAPGLFFCQYDIDEFLKTKAAAYTMVEYILTMAGISMDEIQRFYVAGAFGTHVNKESAVTIGLYPDIDRSRLISAGNSSLKGARRLLLDIDCLKKLPGILENMTYVQFGDVGDFLHIMVGATALPHTDIQRYPSVIKKLKDRGILL